MQESKLTKPRCRSRFTSRVRVEYLWSSKFYVHHQWLLFQLMPSFFFPFSCDRYMIEFIYIYSENNCWPSCNDEDIKHEKLRAVTTVNVVITVNWFGFGCQISHPQITIIIYIMGFNFLLGKHCVSCYLSMCFTSKGLIIVGVVLKHNHNCTRKNLHMFDVKR